jgi:hypothetical protein
MVILTTEVQRMAQGVDGRESASALRTNDSLTVVFPANLQRPSAHWAFLHEHAAPVHRKSPFFCNQDTSRRGKFGLPIVQRTDRAAGIAR